MNGADGRSNPASRPKLVARTALLLIAAVIGLVSTLSSFVNLWVFLVLLLIEAAILGVVWRLNRDIVRAGGRSMWSRES